MKKIVMVVDEVDGEHIVSSMNWGYTNRELLGLFLNLKKMYLERMESDEFGDKIIKEMNFKVEDDGDERD